MGLINGVLLLYLFLLGCLLLSLHAKSTSLNRTTYIVSMDVSLMPKPFTNLHNWYSSTIDSLKFANPASFNNHQSSSPSLVYTYEHGLGIAMLGFEIGIRRGTADVGIWEEDVFVMVVGSGAYAKDLRVRHYVEQMEDRPYRRHEKTLENEKEQGKRRERRKTRRQGRK
ncbi:Subtilisin-like protease [Fagus crenata]